MPRRSAGLLIYRRRAAAIEVFLVHPGGPFWKNKDAGSWSIPKGEFAEGEDPLSVARRELREETGICVEGRFLPLTPARQRGGKIVHAFAVEADFECSEVASNTFALEWPPRSGRMQEFPEVDRAGWFSLEAAHQKILDAQRPLLVELVSLAGGEPP